MCARVRALASMCARVRARLVRMWAHYDIGASHRGACGTRRGLFDEAPPAQTAYAPAQGCRTPDMCMRACACVCVVCVCVYAHTHTHAHMCVCVCVCCAGVRACVRACVVRARVRARVCMCARVGLHLQLQDIRNKFRPPINGLGACCLAFCQRATKAAAVPRKKYADAPTGAQVQQAIVDERVDEVPVDDDLLLRTARDLRRTARAQR